MRLRDLILRVLIISLLPTVLVSELNEKGGDERQNFLSENRTQTIIKQEGKNYANENYHK
jgi:hypothetical protein